MSKDIVELAKAASEKLDQKLFKHNESKIAARLYVEGVLDQHPKVKLPQLLALPETERLMTQYGVSKNMLSTALTEARAKRKANEAKPEIKVPPRKRQRTKKSEGAQHRVVPTCCLAGCRIRRRRLAGWPTELSPTSRSIEARNACGV